MLAGLELFVSLDWGRFAALDARDPRPAAPRSRPSEPRSAAAAREVRASSLLAFMVSLPIAFLSLVPSGTVSPDSLYDAIQVVAAIFPFDPALRAFEGALEAGGPSIWAALGHLAILVVAYFALARVALRRFA